MIQKMTAFCLVLISLTVSAQNISVPFEIKLNQAKLLIPYVMTEKTILGTKKYGTQVKQMETHGGLLESVTDLQMVLNDLSNNSQIKEMAYWGTQATAHLAYEDTISRVNVAIEQKAQVSLLNKYIVDGKMWPGLNHEVDVAAFDKSNSQCSIVFRLPQGFIGHVARSILTGETESTYQKTLSAPNAASCIQAGLSHYAEYIAKNGNAKNGEFEIAFITRLTNPDSWYKSSTFNVQSYILRTKTNDPIILDDYGKFLSHGN
jgi:hypothetical protein